MATATAKKAAPAATSKTKKGTEAKETFTPVFVHRSDGKEWILQSSHSYSAPATEQDPELVRYMASLGRSIKTALFWPQEQEYMVHLPEGYQLRLKTSKSKEGKSSSRTDQFLFGYPISSNESYLYRSPNEFLPHLLWLMSDSVDPTDCICKNCTRAFGASKKASKAMDAGPAATSPNITTEALGKAAPPPAGQVPVQPSAAAPNAPPARPVAASPPTPRLPDSALMFRIGEMVWFRETAWRIGIITAIEADPGAEPGASGDAALRFTLAPLGHAALHQLLHQKNTVKKAADMRPFLTYSVPQTTGVLAGKTFGEVDWPAFAQEHASNNAHSLAGLVLEASKMAAKAIDRSYSPFNRMAPASPTRLAYGGVFLGAEQVRVGDPIRLKAQPGLVMEVREVYEETTTGSLVLNFSGNIYRLKSFGGGGSGAPDAQQQPQGAAFQQEVQFRNQVQQAAGVRWAWELVEQGVVRAEADMGGRFYLTAVLMPLVEPALFRAALEKGAVEDASAYLNNRMHGGGGYIGRMPNRRAAIGAGISAEASAQLVMGEGIIEEN